MGIRTLLVGLGKGGSALLPHLLADPEFELIAVCDRSEHAPGLQLAAERKLPVCRDADEAILQLRPQLVIDVTGDPSMSGMIRRILPDGASVIAGDAARLLWELFSAVEGHRRSETQLGRLVSDMRSGLVVVENAHIGFVNRALCDLLGRREEELLGRAYGEILDEEVRQRDLAVYHARVSGGGAPEEYETRLRHADGSVREVIVCARRSEWEGRPASVAVMSDVTALRQLQREREQFFRFMVHELRAPLAPLAMAIPLLRDPKVIADPARLDPLVHLLTRSTDRMQSFVDDFLSLSKLDQMTLRVTREPVDLKALLEDVVESQRILAEDKGLSIRLEPWEEFAVRGDPFVVRTLAQNLVNNAIKYTRAGGVAISVTRDAAGFSVRVADTGAGVTPEEQAHLFQEFGRIRRTAGVKGSGLGLALVNKLVQSCRGAIRVESRGKDQGSAFTFSLPLVFGEPEAKA
jgi:two-component system, OmpR family, phosphate regulon sensor histidine kinase PhoR